MLLFKLIAVDTAHRRTGGRSISNLSSGETITGMKADTHRQSLNFENYKEFYFIIIELDMECQYVCLFLEHLQDCLD